MSEKIEKKIRIKVWARGRPGENQYKHYFLPGHMAPGHKTVAGMMPPAIVLAVGQEGVELEVTELELKHLQADVFITVQNLTAKEAQPVVKPILPPRKLEEPEGFDAPQPK